MNKIPTTHVAQSIIENILHKGADSLYHKYINSKLPKHTYELQATSFDTNFDLADTHKPSPPLIETVIQKRINNIHIDSIAPKKINISKQNNKFTLSPKNTTFCKSTNYNTITQSLIPISQINNKFQYHVSGQNPLRITSRPFTMQSNRKTINPQLSSNNKHHPNLSQKRASTCHTRKRKVVNANQTRFIKMNNQHNIQLQQQYDQHIRQVKQQKYQKQQNILKSQQKIKLMKQKRQQIALKQLEQAKQKLKGKKKQTPDIIGFDNSQGQIHLNTTSFLQKTNILNIQFNPNSQNASFINKSINCSVQGKKKSIWSTSITKRKNNLTKQQYENNGKRQTSSIPFVTLQNGSTLSQTSPPVSLSKKRPFEDKTLQQFNYQNSKNKFISHIPIVNTTRLNFYATIDNFGQQRETDSTYKQRKGNNTTRDTRNVSIAWQHRRKPDPHRITISNNLVFRRQLLDD